MQTKTPFSSRVISKKLALLSLLCFILFTFCSKTVAQEKKVAEIYFKHIGCTNLKDYYAETIFTIIDEKGNKIGEKKIDELSADEIKRIPISDSIETTKEVEDANKMVIIKTVPIAIEINIGQEKPNDNSKITYRYDTLPIFPGGLEELNKFIDTNFKVPIELKKGGKIFASFMVETDGSLSEIQILRDLSFETGKETIRVLKLSPKWIPGKSKDGLIRMKYTLPIFVRPR